MKFLHRILNAIDKILYQLIFYTGNSNKFQIDFYALSGCLPGKRIHYRETGLISRQPDSVNKILYQILFFIYSGKS
jgi:hypothetical protein